MNKKIVHILLPAVMSVLFLAIAATPVHLLDCLTRGLAALFLALCSELLSLAAAIVAIRKTRNDPDSAWWVLSALIFMIPVIALLILG